MSIGLIKMHTAVTLRVVLKKNTTRGAFLSLLAGIRVLFSSFLLQIIAFQCLLGLL